MIKQTAIVVAITALAIFQTACNKNGNNNRSQNEYKKMETNKQLVMQAYTLLNKGDLDGYTQLFAHNTKNHGQEVGREGIKFVVGDIMHTFPDVNLTPVSIFAEGDWVISRDIFKGTFKNKASVPHHGGLLMTHEPTNKSFSVQHIHVFKVENNLITEHFASRDDVEMYQQLGVLPPAPVFAPPAPPVENK
jgi:predicted ester cyclase